MRTQFICLALAIVLLCPIASAQWVQINGDIGLYYSDILSLALVGTNLFAGTSERGVFLSTNNGSSWTAVSEGLPRWAFSGRGAGQYDTTNYYYYSIQCLAVSGTNLFAGTSERGVFLSTNNGSSWTAVSEGLPRLAYDTTNYSSIQCLAVSGTNLFAGTSGGGVFLSTNNGTNWTAVNSGLIDTEITSDPAARSVVNVLTVSGTNLFAGTDGGGVFLSTNNGSSWTAVSEGLPRSAYDTTNYYYYSIQCLAVSGTNLFAGTSERGVFLSTNNGSSWTAVSEGLPRLAYDTTNYSSIQCLAVSGANLFAVTQWRYKPVDASSGVYHSTNNGTTWTAVGLLGLARDRPQAGRICLAVSGTNLFAGTSERGVFLSTNNGSSWTAVSEGLPRLAYDKTNIECLATSGTNLFAGTSGGVVFLSTNNGTSWTAVNQGSEVRCWASIGQRLFVGTSNQGVFCSTNGGSHWSSAGNNGLPNMGSIIIEINSLASIGQNLYAGTIYGVFLSTDDGTNWSAVNTGLLRSEEYGDYVGIKCLAVSGTNLLAGAYNGVFLSTNYGTSWGALDSASTLGSVRSLAIVGTNLFAATPNGVHRSTSNGALWTAVNTGLANTSVAAFAVAGTDLIAATGNGVYVSTNDGTSWKGLDSASTLGSVQALAIMDTNLFAGTAERGVWRRPLSQIATSVGTVASQLPSEYLLSQNYPNPFNPSTTITYELPKASQVSLTVYDILGREVCVLVNEKKDAGVHEVKFDAAGLASGVYFYRMTAGTYVDTKKLLLIR
jgi:hypothetical protein